MPLTREYRICMPLTVDESLQRHAIKDTQSNRSSNIPVDPLFGTTLNLLHLFHPKPLSNQYKIGQLFMINKHSHDQSDKGEGVEVVINEPCSDNIYGRGQYTEKRIYLNSKLPNWMQPYIPKIFYVTEKASNFYPYTVTEYTCSFVPRFTIHIRTCYKDDNGSMENSLGLSDEELKAREVIDLDIAYDEVPEKYNSKEEDCTQFKSAKTGRGPLTPGWRDFTKPIMCSYKLVRVSFDVWGLRDKVEHYVHKIIKDILLVGHRQAFAWIDQWYDMTLDDVREFEKEMQSKTNAKVLGDESS